MANDDLPPPRAFNHLALPSFDAAATRDFYAGVLGLPLVGAVAGRSAEWGNRDFLHTMYALGDGTIVSFFDLDQMTRPGDDGLPADIRHVALTIGARDEHDAWRRRLDARGAKYWVEDHGGELSIYLTDPNGHVVELTYSRPSFSAEQRRRAPEIVRAWTAQHRPSRES
jgi:catechol 2,3-dioxygenase-like lactoylglutathione lyase family enzyme